MSRPIQLVIPMSGQGVRYQQAGFREPKPLIPVSGTPMIERLLENFPAHWPAHFVLADNHMDTSLPALLARLRPTARISTVPAHQEGPGRALRRALDDIPPDAPVFVSYCDYGMVWDSAQFERFVETTACDACLVSYRGFHPHYLRPLAYAYARLVGERVVEVKEKGSFTADREAEYASAGGYYFRTAQQLREALDYQAQHGLTLNGEAYTSLTIEALLRQQPDAHVRVFECPMFFQWGTPEQLRDFEFFEATYKAKNARHPLPRVDQLVMPMAGKGSRFAELSTQPKPLIALDGIPMFKRAMDSLPTAKQNTLVALEAFAAAVEPWIPPNTEIVRLKTTPTGQALSTEAALERVGEGDVLVSACDHGIVLDARSWNEFRSSPDCDAAIFTVRGYPGAARRPTAYSFVAPASEDPFPLLGEVSVKKPVSDPKEDHLLVGTFWFRDAEVLRQGIAELKKRDVRVNGELYLDSVFSLLQSLGHKIRIVPLSGYLCWGEPEALAETLYYAECFDGHRQSPRARFPGVR